MQEDCHLRSRDDADKFNLATDDGTLISTSPVFPMNGEICEGIDIVQSDHAPEAGVAQGIFHGDLIRHQGGHQEELEEELEEEVERTGEERPLKRHHTSAHAWMT